MLLHWFRSAARSARATRLLNRVSSVPSVRRDARSSKRQLPRRDQRFFGVGRIFENKRYDNHTEHLFQYRSGDEAISLTGSFRSFGGISCERRSNMTSKS